MGIVNASSIEAYPFSTVVFTVEAFDGCYFDDSVSGSIRVYGASEMSPIVYTRFSDPIRDSSDRIISCTYEFVMPTGQANIRCDFLYVSTNDYNIGDNPYTDVGLWRDGSGSYVRFDGDNADDYEITFLSGTDPRRRFALNCTAVPSVEDGRLIVKLTVVHNNRSMTPSLIQTVSSDIPEVNSAEDFIRTALPQIIDRELEQDQITTNNIAVSAVDGQLIIRNRQTQETRTIHIYGTVN